MALVIGSKNGVITGVLGDTEQGFDLYSYLRMKLAEQCLFQHTEQDKTFKGRKIKKFWLEEIDKGMDADPDEDINFYVEYTNGEVWAYRRIAHGSEGMVKELIK